MDEITNSIIALFYRPLLSKFPHYSENISHFLPSYEDFSFISHLFFTDLKKRLKENEDRLSEITKNENSNLISWKETMSWCNKNEQYGRSWCLRIHGHKVQENEDVKKEVVRIIHKNYNLNQ